MYGTDIAYNDSLETERLMFQIMLSNKEEEMKKPV